jgi:dTDP-4-dehydrorhamnose reductase
MRKKRVLLLGSNGMFGSDAALILEENDFEVFPYDLPQVDITDLISLEKTFKETNPEIVINASAYTDVDGAERNRELCFNVNASGAGNVARVCKDFKVFLVHISTDYVFPGDKKEGYLEEDAIGPSVNTYGESKLQGEIKIKEILEGDEFLICRTQWLYGKKRNNFVKKVVSMAKEKSEIEIIDDQWGVPTWTKDLAEQIVYLIKNNFCGFAHTVGGGGPITWYQFAKDIIELLKSNCIVKPISSEKLKRDAIRPEYGFLRNTKIPEEFVRNYKESLKMYLKEESFI